MNPDYKLAASFRDPSGFVFWRAGEIYRQINRCYQADYERLMQSGLYEKLSQEGHLVRTWKIDTPPFDAENAYCVIQPEQIPFISYPYEWCFSQLKDAALLTLEIQKTALAYEMSLKDASAYNIQFLNGRPVLIDTLSFESHEEGRPWIAYRQFCQHFLAPLALMSLQDVRLGQLLRVYIDGIPLDLASSLLPWRSRLNFGLLTHLHVHAGAQKKYAGQAVASSTASARSMTRTAFLGLIDSLENTVRGLQWDPSGTEWANYYEDTNYSQTAFEHKKRLVKEYIDLQSPKLLWDLGANTGEFSRLSTITDGLTVAFDIDPSAVEKHYRTCRGKTSPAVLPLVMDLTNPSPSLGWQLQERQSLVKRAPADMALALALVHHLAISNNVPLTNVAEFLSRIAGWVVVEFIPKEDSQVQRLLANRKDIFDGYHRAGFEEAIAQYFWVREVQEIEGSQRTLYLMETRN